ncbi:hypothetical protein WN944_006550 [Citrus x changshan-huyou]|uniref:Inhibitor I9 domain-containing protein n=1 Tax=Citrus x changshan-huyou TaxID=2935761 RepID=A0AAP0ML94_9ROSI
MAKNGFLLISFLPFILFLQMSVLGGATTTHDDRKESMDLRSSALVYIVYLGSLSRGEYETSSQHQSILQEVVEGSPVENVLVRSYKRSFSGFAAKLTDHERQKLASMEEVVSVFPGRTLQLHTTRSWDFMGFNQSITRKRSVESDIDKQ